MHSAIIVVAIDHPQAWENFTGALARKIKPESKTTRRLGENVWEVDFQKRPSDLAWIVTGCEQYGLAYEILPLADAPRWQKVAPDPKPM